MANKLRSNPANIPVEQLIPARFLQSELNASAAAQRAGAPEPQAAFKQFSASQLYCPKCKTAMAVREKMLLILGSGTLYDLTCVRCHTSLGTRTA